MTNHDEVMIGQQSPQKNIEIELEAQDAEFVEFAECVSCGRKFGRQALAKHKRICKKVFGKKKNSPKDEGKVLASKPGAQDRVLDQVAQNQDQTNPTPAWKKESENFREMLKAARKQNPTPTPANKINKLAPQKVGETPKPTPANIQTTRPLIPAGNHTRKEELVTCDSCNQQFSSEGYKRHVVLCLNKRNYTLNFRKK